jgi:hypothetical protein
MAITSNRTTSTGYNLNNDQYKQLGQDAYNTSKNDQIIGKGWLDIKDYGGKGDYQFAYDDSTNIGSLDPNDSARYLYVRRQDDPNNYSRYSLGDANNPNADMSEVGRGLYSQGDNLLNDFWANFYGWQSSANQPQQPTTPDQPAVTPPGGIQPDQGGTVQPGGGVRVPGPGVGTPTSVENAVDVGMGAAQKILQDMLNMPQYYPDWWGNDYQTIDASKWQEAFPEFLDVPSYEGIDVPGQYQGLMEGDYNRLEESLRTPGEIAAQRAFQEGGNYLKDVMGGKGMYGSSVMGNQANTGLNQRYMDTMASNAAQAASQRYGFEQNDNQFGANYGLQRSDLLRQNALDQYNSDMTGRNLLNDYNNQRFQFDYGLGEAARGERNNLLQNKFQYDLASQQWRNAMNENLMNAALATTGFNANLSNANRLYEQQQQQYNDQSRAGYLGTALDIADRLGFDDYAKQGLGSAWDWAVNKFKG